MNIPSASESIVFGLAAMALVGGGFRAAVLAFAVRRGEVSAPGRARLAARIYAAVAVVGLAVLVWAVLAP